MYHHYDPDEYETVIERHICPFHQHDRAWGLFAACTCSAGVSRRRRSYEEVRQIKADRRQREEDSILAQAEVIRLRRAAEGVGG